MCSSDLGSPATQQPGFEVRLLTTDHHAAAEDWLVRQSAAVVELQSARVDAAADREAEHAELGVGPPADSGLAMEVADDGAAEVVFGLLVRRVLASSTAVAVGVDHAVDDELRESRMDRPTDVPHVGVVLQQLGRETSCDGLAFGEGVVIAGVEQTFLSASS